MRTDYYVYGLFADDICFYVGKGRDDRKYEHFRDFNNRNKAVSPSMYYKLRSLQEQNITPHIELFYENLTEPEALNRETELILKYKRKIDGGTLCNITQGGNQPPSYTELLKIKSREELKKIKDKQRATMRASTYKRNKSRIEQFRLLMSQDIMLKDISKILHVTTTTLRSWSKQHNIPINLNGKTQRIKEHLHQLRQRKDKTVPKTAKNYTIKTPDNNIITIQQLVIFCRDHGLDYANLRRTYKGNARHHKGYSIIDQQDPK